MTAGLGGVGAGVGAGAVGSVDLAIPAGRFASVSMIQHTSPTGTTSPSSTFNVMTPAISAGSSSVALSESTSAMGWSFST